MSAPTAILCIADPREAAAHYIEHVYDVPLPDKSKLEITKAFVAGCTHTMTLLVAAEALPEEARRKVFDELMTGVADFVEGYIANLEKKQS